MVRFVECGGLAPLLAPGRGTYGSVRGQRRAGCFIQRCKGGVLKHIKMPKWRHMRAFSSSVSEWRGDAVTASGNRLVTASGYVTACGDAVTARGYRVRPTRITREPDVVTA